ncbi:MAG: SgcJ/EcaC family oxidoreductase [Gemmatimonadota bacterium]|nr:SgcJ/EcaC family oxidoreductase [Gemmatimonadota bacterium]MDH3479790.1 SgcJ/EcaC family oxidoreductase [Gemmatimonadota bacterium]MDH3569166.1 SgcJ/EcaC family oxidoreductase [Gemmatimonadota bacterium]MDH5549263.1 SgcJ/EcaC family oxidoreductase [Gemmatimonadota bacterium]
MRRPIFAISAILLAACSAIDGQQATTTQVDAEAIMMMLAEYDTAATAGNVDAYMALYADDAVSMPPDAPARTGKEEIRAAFVAFLEENTVQLTSQVDEVRVSGDLAFLRVAYDETVTPKAGGEPTQLHGKWLVILERQPDGSWKWWHEMWSNYTPPEM